MTGTSPEGSPEGAGAERGPACAGGSKHSRWALEEDQRSDGDAVEEEPYDLVVRRGADGAAGEADEKMKPNLR